MVDDKGATFRHLFRKMMNGNLQTILKTKNMKTETHKVNYTEVQGMAHKFPGTKAKELVMKFLADGQIIRPCFYSGTGKYCKIMEHTSAVKMILELAGVQYEHGNDAPRGGRIGDFIKVTSEIVIG